VALVHLPACGLAKEEKCQETRPDPKSQPQIAEYRKWSIERRLQWLFLANKMRKFLPKRTIEIQEAFRKGEI
jgi:hypothetical protein